MAGKTWRMLLKEVDNLKKDALNTIFERTKLLIKIKDDPGFLQWCEDSAVNPEDILDQRLDDVCVINSGSPFMLAAKIMGEYPRKSEWRKLGWRGMQIEIEKRERAERDRELSMSNEPDFSSPLVSTGPSVDMSGADIDDMDELQRLQAENSKLKQKIESLEGEVRRRKAEVVRLKQKLAAQQKLDMAAA